MDAFIAKIPELRIRFERISDEEIEKNNERILGSCDEKRVEEFLPAGDKTPVSEKTEAATNETEKAILSPELKEVLMSIKIFQHRRSVTEIATLVDKPFSTFSRILEQLERNNLIQNVKVNIGKRNYKYPVLTEKAYEVLGLSVEKTHTRGGGTLHTVLVNLIAEHLKKYRPKIEYLRIGKFVDLHFEIDGLTIAIEVERSEANVLNNVTEDFAVGYDYVVVVGKDKRAAETIRNVLEDRAIEKVRDRLSILTIEELLALKDIRQLIASK